MLYHRGSKVAAQKMGFTGTIRLFEVTVFPLMTNALGVFSLGKLTTLVINNYAQITLTYTIRLHKNYSLFADIIIKVCVLQI